MENEPLKSDLYSNPFDLKEIVSIAIKRKALILVFLILSLLSVFIYILLSKHLYSSQIYINSNSIPAYHTKYILTDLQTMVSNQSNKNIYATLKKYFNTPEQIQSLNASIISDNPGNESKIVEVDITGFSDSVIQFVNSNIIDYLAENKLIKNLSDMELSKMVDEHEIIKQNIKIIEYSIREVDSLMTYPKVTSNTVFSGAKGEMVETLVKLNVRENDLKRRINSFQPFLIMNDPIVTRVSTYGSKARLFLIGSLFGLAFGLFVAIFIEYSRK